MDDDEKVGYKKPPKKSRFKKGESGNPSGRPKEKPNRIMLLRNYLMDEMDLPTGERVSRMHYSDRKLWAMSAQGNLQAMKFLNKLVEVLPDMRRDDDEGESRDLPPAQIIKIHTVDARHPKTIAKEAAEKAGGIFVENKDDVKKK